MNLTITLNTIQPFPRWRHPDWPADHEWDPLDCLNSDGILTANVIVDVTVDGREFTLYYQPTPSFLSVSSRLTLNPRVDKNWEFLEHSQKPGREVVYAAAETASRYIAQEAYDRETDKLVEMKTGKTKEPSTLPRIYPGMVL